MIRTSHFFLTGAVILILLTTACAGQQATPTVTFLTVELPTSTPLGGVTATAETATAVESPTVSVTETTTTLATSVVASPTGATQTPGIPITGVNVVLVECQFCIDKMAHALLILPDSATFKVTSTTTSSTNTTLPTCSTVEVNNGKQVVLCSGPEMTPITLNICTDSNTCTDFPVDLFACPLAPAGTVAAPTNGTPGVTATEGATSTPAAVTSTPTP